MSSCTVKIYWSGGSSLLKGVEGSPEELEEYYRKALNNKKDRSITWTSSEQKTVLNLDNVIAFEIVKEHHERTRTEDQGDIRPLRTSRP